MRRTRGLIHIYVAFNIGARGTWTVLIELQNMNDIPASAAGFEASTGVH